MTAAELIAILSAMPQDTPVVMYERGDGGYRAFGYRDVSARELLLAPKNATGFYPRFVRLTDRNNVKAILVE